MSRPENREIALHRGTDVSRTSPRQPIIERLPRNDKIWLNATLCTSGTFGLSLSLTGYPAGFLLVGASAAIYGVEWVIERVIDPKTKINSSK